LCGKKPKGASKATNGMIAMFVFFLLGLNLLVTSMLR